MIGRCKQALRDNDIELVENDLRLPPKRSGGGNSAVSKGRQRGLPGLVFRTWVWASHMVPAIREFAKTGKGIVIWTYPLAGVGAALAGLVLKAGLRELGIKHRFVYGKAEDEKGFGKGSQLPQGVRAQKTGLI